MSEARRERESDGLIKERDELLRVPYVGLCESDVERCEPYKRGGRPPGGRGGSAGDEALTDAVHGVLRRCFFVYSIDPCLLLTCALNCRAYYFLPASAWAIRALALSSACSALLLGGAAADGEAGTEDFFAAGPCPDCSAAPPPARGDGRGGVAAG